MFRGGNRFWLWQMWHLSFMKGVGQSCIWGPGWVGHPKPWEQCGLMAGWVLRPRGGKGRLGPRNRALNSRLGAKMGKLEQGTDGGTQDRETHFRKWLLRKKKRLRAGKASLSRSGTNAEYSLSGMTGDRWVRWQGKWVGWP